MKCNYNPLTPPQHQLNLKAAFTKIKECRSRPPDLITVFEIVCNLRNALPQSNKISCFCKTFKYSSYEKTKTYRQCTEVTNLGEKWIKN